jgi:hypothetical protein
MSLVQSCWRSDPSWPMCPLAPSWLSLIQVHALGQWFLMSSVSWSNLAGGLVKVQTARLSQNSEATDLQWSKTTFQWQSWWGCGLLGWGGSNHTLKTLHMAVYLLRTRTSMENKDLLPTRIHSAQSIPCPSSFREVGLQEWALLSWKEALDLEGHPRLRAGTMWVSCSSQAIRHATGWVVHEED